MKTSQICSLVLSKNKLAFILLLLVITFLSNSCKKDCHDASNPDCENYDPCYGKKPVTAELLLEQQLNWGGEMEFYPEDSIFWRYCVRFSCPDKSVKKYTWILGSETLHDQSFTRCFGGQPFGEYEVKLIIEKDSDLSCFPNDDGIDTIIRKFKMVNVCDFLMDGTFRGRWDSKSNEEFEISINLYDVIKNQKSCDEGQDGVRGLLISNFFNDNTPVIVSRWGLTNTYLKSNFGKSDGVVKGEFLFELKIDPVSYACTIILYDRYLNSSGNIVLKYRDTFHGKKIQ